MPAYPAPSLGWEFVLDKDGTVVKENDAGSNILTAPSILLFNNYDLGTNLSCTNSQGALRLLFPQARTIRALSLSATWRTNEAAALSLDTSTDTTDGVNGTWVVGDTFTTSTGYNWSLSQVRTPRVYNWPGIKGIRLLYSSGSVTSVIKELHIWGTYTLPGLQLTHPTLDQPLIAADMDFGDIQRNQLINKTFRVKNVSAQTANSVVIALENQGSNGIYAGTDLIYSSTTAKSHNIGNLTPGAFSSIITAQRLVGGAENQTIPGSVRLGVVAGSWT